jgi:regulator of replication initiation timing
MSGKTLIESIAKGTERLMGENRRLRGEINRLEASRNKLREENHRLAALNATLERRLTVKDLANGFTGQATTRQDAKIARARVGRLMREVDQCIALINKD